MRRFEPPWRGEPGWPHITIMAAGGVMAAAGIALVGITVRQFATEGRGTLAPWDPTRRLVVNGVYRYVRNPMISGVFLVLLGEAAILMSAGILLWAAAFWVLNAVYIPLVEERGLERRFGASYAEYRRHVPRWLPRTKPWQPSGAAAP
jgi:protein-S-isoprenylcysteine O-methyltransferase Ste14